MPKVSVIIPCYNQGKFLLETLQSVYDQTYSKIEIIVVNDGSTEEFTRQLLGAFSHPLVTVVHTDNQGLAAARNNGIKVAQGEYILPLDSDDRIGPDYIEKAVAVLDSNPSIGIVYCRAQLFGGVNTEWMLPEYSLAEMLKDNLIFCSALFRRSDWEDVGGYDPGMVYGWEDYDFWLSLIEKGRGVYRIPEVCFYYRVAPDSMVRSKEKGQKVEMFKRIYQRHQNLFNDNIEIWIEELLETRERYYTSRLYVDCGEGISDKSSVSLKVDKGTSSVHFRLDQYQGIRSLRFDPVDVPAVVELFSCTCLFDDGTKKEITDFSDNAVFRKGGNRYFDTNDSQCFFSLTKPELSQLASVTVVISYKAFESTALAMIVQELKTRREVSAKKTSLASALRSKIGFP